MKMVFHKNIRLGLYLLPTLVVCIYFLKFSHSQPLHDFSNSYFPARLVYEGAKPETIIFDIHKFNTYVWDRGYRDELVDYYVNSPFTLFLFYPLATISNAYHAKLVFNVISILCLLLSLVLLARAHLRTPWMLLLVPFVFFVPIRNQILFGQSYFIILFLVLLGFSLILKNKKILGSGIWSIAILLKFFPAFYGIALLVQRRWKAILISVLATIVLVVLAVTVTGYSLWEYYFFDVLPHTIESSTTTDFRVNYQSIDVFLKKIFVKDLYYNPAALFDNQTLYFWLNWLLKGSILGGAIYASIIKRRVLMTLLSIWVVALFLLQSRTATYAQLLWVIPLISILQLRVSTKAKLLFVLVITLVCNFPFHLLNELAVGVQFMRLWLVLILAILFYSLSVRVYKIRYMLVALALLIPFHTSIFGTSKPINSSYVIGEKTHFMIYDFYDNDGFLAYRTLGKNKEEEFLTNIAITSFNEEAVSIKDHQLFYRGKQLTFNAALKQKPVLVNGCDVYFLSDYRSRRAVFTLKKLSICQISEKTTPVKEREE